MRRTSPWYANSCLLLKRWCLLYWCGRVRVRGCVCACVRGWVCEFQCACCLCGASRIVVFQIGKLTRAQTSAIRIHRELASAMSILCNLAVVASVLPAKGKRKEAVGLAAMGLGLGLHVDGSYRYVG